MSREHTSGKLSAVRAYLKRKPRLQIVIIACLAYGLLFAFMAIVAIGIALQLSAE
jgi:hypothetical protein